MLRIAFLRKDMNLNQKEIQKLLRIPHSLYSTLEQGRLTKPYDYIVEKCEKFFGMSMDKLLEEIEVADDYFRNKYVDDKKADSKLEQIGGEENAGSKGSRNREQGSRE